MHTKGWRLGIAAVVALTGGALVVPQVGPSAARAQSLVNCDVDMDQPMDLEELVALTSINSFRAENGLGSLAYSDTLTRASRWKAAALSQGGAFSHDDPDRSMAQRLVDCGYGNPVFVEDLGGGLDTASSMIDFWKQSELHRGNLLFADGRTIGIARRQGPGEYEWYWCVVIGVE